MKQYLDLLADVRANGVKREDRTGTGTLSVFGRQMRFDLSKGFPLVTTKSVYWKGVVGELVWIISGNTNVRWLQERNIHIWDEWADEKGDLGPIYGKQMRNFGADGLMWRTYEDYVTSDGEIKPSYIIHQHGPIRNSQGVDQLKNVVEQIKTNPYSRRHIVTAWNPIELPLMALAPCHCFFQFYVAEGKLSCQLYQRSCDLFLGVPFNIASYSLLTHMVAKVCDLEPGEFIWTGGDCHIYLNHLEQVDTQLKREPYSLPMLKLPKKENVWDYEIEDCVIENYKHHERIKAPVAV